jgi:hypothetical protein
MAWPCYKPKIKIKLEKLVRCESFLEKKSAVIKFSLELVLCIVSFFSKGIGWCYDSTPTNRNQKNGKEERMP